VLRGERIVDLAGTRKDCEALAPGASASQSLRAHSEL
jgi:hypothetical protein